MLVLSGTILTGRPLATRQIRADPVNTSHDGPTIPYLCVCLVPYTCAWQLPDYLTLYMSVHVTGFQ